MKLRNFILLLLSVSCLALNTGCTSNESQEEEVAESDEITADSQSLADEDGDETGEETGESSVAEAPAEAPADAPPAELPAEALGETSPADSTIAEAPAETSAEAPMDMSALSEPPPEEAPIAEAPAPLVPEDDGTSSSSDTAIAPPPEAPSEPEAAPAPVADEPKPVASLKKVEAAPFKRGGQLLNAVYFAKPGDSFAKIASTVYGDESRAKDLKKANPFFSKPKPGDKIYYNSPNRPTDDTAMKTYYEEAGIAPQVYVAQQGDNLRAVSKNLLGYDGAWKEVWAANSFEEKGDLAAGTEIRYWNFSPADAPAAAPAPPAPATDVAEANPPSELPPPTNEIPPPPIDAGVPPAMEEVPPPMEASMEQFPPPADLPPPPPPPVDLPPPPPPSIAQEGSDAGMEGSMDEAGGAMGDDMTSMALGAGILVAGAAALIIMRKRRQQKEQAAQAFGDSQVGT